MRTMETMQIGGCSVWFGMSSFRMQGGELTQHQFPSTSLCRSHVACRIVQEGRAMHSMSNLHLLVPHR